MILLLLLLQPLWEQQVSQVVVEEEVEEEHRDRQSGCRGATRQAILSWQSFSRASHPPQALQPQRELTGMMTTA